MRGKDYEKEMMDKSKCIEILFNQLRLDEISFMYYWIDDDEKAFYSIERAMKKYTNMVLDELIKTTDKYFLDGDACSPTCWMEKATEINKGLWKDEGEELYIKLSDIEEYKSNKSE